MVEEKVEAAGLPWMETEPLAGAGGAVRVSWTVHSDVWRDGGRRGAHRGPCGRDDAHAVLWHWCPDAERWLPSACPEGGLDGSAEVRWPRCCGLRWRAAAAVSGR